MASLLIDDECSICGYSMRIKEENMTTECGHTFHRSGAQKRLDKKNNGDCKICQKKLALANALRECQTMTTITQMTPYRSKPVENVCL